MFCSNCGKELEQGANFCANCGSAVAGGAKGQYKVNEDVVKEIFRVKTKEGSNIYLGILVCSLIFMAIGGLLPIIRLDGPFGISGEANLFEILDLIKSLNSIGVEENTWNVVIWITVACYIISVISIVVFFINLACGNTKKSLCDTARVASFCSETGFVIIFVFMVLVNSETADYLYGAKYLEMTMAGWLLLTIPFINLFVLLNGVVGNNTTKIEYIHIDDDEKLQVTEREKVEHEDKDMVATASQYEGVSQEINCYYKTELVNDSMEETYEVYIGIESQIDGESHKISVFWTDVLLNEEWLKLPTEVHVESVDIGDFVLKIENENITIRYKGDVYTCTRCELIKAKEKYQIPDWYQLGCVIVKNNQICSASDSFLHLFGSDNPLISVYNFDDSGIFIDERTYEIYEKEEYAKYTVAKGVEADGYTEEEASCSYYCNIVETVFSPEYSLKELKGNTMNAVIKYYEELGWENIYYAK